MISLYHYIGVSLANKYTITISWETGRKIEKKKFEYEELLKKKLTWDDFFKTIIIEFPKEGK